MRKFLPYILILLILVGLFSPMVQVGAQVVTPPATPATTPPPAGTPPATGTPPTCTGTSDNGARTPAGCIEIPATKNSTDSAFKQEIDSSDTCGAYPPTWFSGCLLRVFYYTYFQLPSWILWLSAQFFDVMINLGINSSVTSASGFIPTAWAVVRDLSNIFFILVLLYVAIQTILGLGHETKKVIVRVIIMALLINFSMFFTKIVIDSSNILALVFYNKLDVNTKNLDGTSRPKDPALQGGKDISAAMWRTFDATQLISPTTITLLKTTTVKGITTVEKTLPFSLTLGIMVVAGSIMLFSAYTFFIAGLMFIGRLIELWILIIFSPFAFMSWTIPKFAGVEYLGWDAWLKRLISTSFMAPIFMFFLYLIFMILPGISTFTRGDETTILGTILNILIPAIIVMAILLKATEFAKEGGGEFGKILLTGAKMVGGLALGAATGGAGFALRAGLGGAAAKIAGNDTLKAAAAGGDKGAQRKLALANSFANKSFDIRDTGFGKFAAKQSGMDFDKGTGPLSTKNLEGGYKGQVKKEAEAEEKKFKTYEVGTVSGNQKIRAEQYIKDKETAKNNGKIFNAKSEKAFKKSYEGGQDLRNYGINKKVDAGSVAETVKDENAYRRTTYADSLVKKGDAEEARGAMKTFWNDFKEGANKADRGIVSKTAIGVGTLGAAPAIEGFLNALKGVLGPRATNTEVISMVRKGVKDDKEKAWEHLKHAMEGDHDNGHDKKGGEHKETNSPAAHPPRPRNNTAKAEEAHPPAEAH